MTLILTNHSGATCYVNGYPGLAFYNGNGFPMTTHLTWTPQPHSQVLLRPAGNAQALLTWRVNINGPTPFNPDLVHITPPGEHAYLWAIWPGGPVMGGSIASWPLRAAPAGPFPACTGTVAGPFNGMCMTLAADGTTVVARKCGPGASSQHVDRLQRRHAADQQQVPGRHRPGGRAPRSRWRPAPGQPARNGRSARCPTTISVRSPMPGPAPC